MSLSKVVLSIFVALLALTDQSQLQHQAESKHTSFVADLEYQIHQVLECGKSLDQTEKGKYYIGPRGRLRYEFGPKITISDPRQNITWVFETDAKVARKYDHNKLRSSQPESAQSKSAEFSFKQTPDSTTINKSGDQQGLTNIQNIRRRPLGNRVIEGVECVGQEVISVIPANSGLGNKEPITSRVETWYSKDLRISVLTINENPLFGSSVMKLKNIKTVSEMDENLFRVPDGYRIVEHDDVLIK
jgi:hypothetical protein